MSTICTTCGELRVARWTQTAARAVAVRRGRAVRVGPARAAVLGLRYECACSVPARPMGAETSQDDEDGSSRRP